MEIAFYILLVSWVILLVCCIVAIARFKKANDSLDTSLDTVIDLNEEIQSLMNQLDVAEQDLDFWKDTCDKMQGTINDLNKRIGNMKHDAEDKSIIYVDKAYVEYITTCINVSAEIIKDITDGNLKTYQMENSLHNSIKDQITNELLSYAKYYTSYDIVNNSYAFKVMIPIAVQNGSKCEYDRHSRIPLTDILLDKVKEEQNEQG